MIETIPNLIHRHRRKARCRQLDSQGDPIEASTDLGGCVYIAYRETRRHTVSPLGEQIHSSTDI
jgi:hypothetical protein